MPTPVPMVRVTSPVIGVAVLLTAAFVPPAAATTHTVGSGQDYPSIQAALADDTTVLAGDTLLVDPGVYPQALIVDRALAIVSTGDSGDTILQGSGAGTGVRIEADGVSLQGLTLENWTRCLDVAATVTILAATDVIIGSSTGYPVSAPAAVIGGAIADLDLVARSSYNAVQIVASTLGEDATWSSLGHGHAYSLVGRVNIEGAGGVTLTLSPGTVFKNDVNGALRIGSGAPGRLEAQRVRFTSVQDDQVLGDTNGDGMTQPEDRSPREWQNVEFRFQATGVIEETRFEYGGGGNQGVLRCNGSPSGEVQVIRSVFRRSHSGFEVTNNTRPAIQNCCFVDNDLFGVVAQFTDGQGDLDVTSCYWGPGGGPGESGNNDVTAQVDASNWLEQCGIPVPVLVRSFEARAGADAVTVEWSARGEAALRLQGRAGTQTWVVPHRAFDEDQFRAVDRTAFGLGLDRVEYQLLTLQGERWQPVQTTTVILFAPRGLQALAVAPNPFNPRAQISFELGRRGDVQVVVYNARGEKVRTLLDENRLPGRVGVVWDGRDARGALTASGVYFVRVHGDGQTKVQKVVLVR